METLCVYHVLNETTSNDNGSKASIFAEFDFLWIWRKLGLHFELAFPSKLDQFSGGGQVTSKLYSLVLINILIIFLAIVCQEARRSSSVWEYYWTLLQCTCYKICRCSL